MTAPGPEGAPPRDRAAGSGGWVHFGVATGVMAAAVVGLNVLLHGKFLAKRAVPPPARVEVSEHRLTSFPSRLGPYELAPEGETEAPSDRDHERDGIMVPDEHLLETLGTYKHDLNWYYMAVYRGRARPLKGAKVYMHLDLTYYTGLLEAVPHVPERCLVAGGKTIVRGRSKPIRLRLPELPAPWNEIDVYRTVYTDRQGRRFGAQYHVFSMNGLPAWEWETVRWEMGKLTRKYCYFAKIQLAPRGAAIGTLEASDAVCRDFLAHALPAILEFLPTAADVRKLEAQ